MIYATATGFSHGGLFEPEVGRTRLYMGEGEPRDYSTAGSPRPSNTREEVTIIEDDFSSFRLPEGTYWLLTSNSAEIALVTCVPGGVTADPA